MKMERKYKDRLFRLLFAGEKVRSYSRKQTIEGAVEECIREGILAELLSRYRAEAIEVSIFEYNEEEHMKLVCAEGWEDGWEEGRQEGILQERANAQREIDLAREEIRKLKELWRISKG